MMPKFVIQIFIILLGATLHMVVMPGDRHAVIATVNFPTNSNRQVAAEFVNKDASISFEVSQLDLVLLKTLKEVFEGPLSQRSVVLLIDDGNDGAYDQVQLLFLLNSLGIPATLLDMSERDDVIGMLNETADESTVYNESSSNSQANSDTSRGKADPKALQLNEREDRPSLSPPPSWPFVGLLVISKSLNCAISTLLEDPFAQRTTSVALFCPVLAKEDPFVAFKVYSWKPFQPNQKIVYLGLWSPSVFVTWDHLFIDRFSSFSGLTLHVASDKNDMPILFLDTEGEYDGISKRLMDALAAAMNFTYTLTPKAKDGGWGVKVDGKWLGLLGEAWRGEKNLTINSFSITRERVQDFEVSAPFYRVGIGFYVLNPPPLPRWLSLTYSFTVGVWAATAITLILTAMGFYLLSYGRQKSMSPFNSFLTITQGLMKQSITKVPETWHLRIFLALWWLGTYVIVVSYCCNLIAILTVPLYPPKLQTLKHLAESDYRVCYLNYGTFVPKALATSQDSSLSAIGAKLDLVPPKNQEWFGDEACIEKVLIGDHAHMIFSTYMDNAYTKMGHIEKVYRLRELIFEASLAFFFPKNTPWAYKFDWGIQQVVESHLIHKWHSDILRQQRISNVKEASASTDKPLTLAHLQGPFILLVFGFFVSKMAFGIEFLRHHSNME